MSLHRVVIALGAACVSLSLFMPASAQAAWADLPIWTGRTQSAKIEVEGGGGPPYTSPPDEHVLPPPAPDTDFRHMTIWSDLLHYGRPGGPGPIPSPSSADATISYRTRGTWGIVDDVIRMGTVYVGSRGTGDAHAQGLSPFAAGTASAGHGLSFQLVTEREVWMKGYARYFGSHPNVGSYRGSFNGPGGWSVNSVNDGSSASISYRQTLSSGTFTVSLEADTAVSVAGGSPTANNSMHGEFEYSLWVGTRAPKPADYGTPDEEDIDLPTDPTDPDQKPNHRVRHGRIKIIFKDIEEIGSSDVVEFPNYRIGDLENDYGPVERPEIIVEHTDGTLDIINARYNGVFNDGAEITFEYNPALLPEGTDESRLVLLHYGADGWESLTGVVDTALNTITADTTSLSPFVLALSPVPEPASLAILTVPGLALLRRRRA